VLSNSISEKLFLEINGTKQAMFIKGENIDNPIILFLHGGIPVYFLTEKFPTHLEKNFTMIWWEQRGCGISNHSNSTNNTTTLDQLVDDSITLTKYILKRFDKKKIYLMGHSGGSFIGVHVIDKAPELYDAYIGIAQMSDQRKSEKIAYDYMLSKYQELEDQKKLKTLQQISFGDSGDVPDEYIKIRDASMHEIGIGTMRNMKNLITDLIFPSLMFSEYTLSEKYTLWYNKSQSGISQSWKRMINTNLMESNISFQVPVYFFHGIDDYTCSYELAKEYFAKISAPIKGFYTFNKSAHSPLLEEPIKMNNILVNDIINSRTELADKF
jgi:pimeloyl-ACP methyl ester carboxylesterase